MFEVDRFLRYKSHNNENTFSETEETEEKN